MENGIQKTYVEVNESEILARPNDSDLGKFVRTLFYSSSKIKQNGKTESSGNSGESEKISNESE